MSLNMESTLEFFTRGTRPSPTCSVMPGRVRKQNGKYHYGIFCPSCGGQWVFTTPKGERQDWVRKSMMIEIIEVMEPGVLDEYPIEELCPIMRCLKCKANQKCEVKSCDRTDTEHHHWAIKEKFNGDADDWPMSWLCTAHHRGWHSLVTPYLPGYGSKDNG